MKKFVIISRQRSGSTVLVRSLDQHKQIFCAGEIFLNSKKTFHNELNFPAVNIVSKSKEIFLIINYFFGLIRVNSYLNNFFNRPEINGFDTVGFKLMINQIKLYPMTLKWIKKNELKKIILIRENPLEILVSYIRIKKIRKPHLDLKNHLETEKVFIETRNILKKLEKIERENQKLLKLSNQDNSLLIYYEEIFKWDDLMKKIYQFLEVDYQTIQPVLKKISKNSIQENVENYNELVKALENSKYRTYLD